MNPAHFTEAYPPGNVGLHDRKCDGFSGQPGEEMALQHTVVTVPAEPPKDYLIWSLFNFVYGNICCFGLVALIFSVKARDRKVVGDQDGARRHSSTARIFNIVATVMICSAVLIYIIVYIVLFMHVRRW